MSSLINLQLRINQAISSRAPCWIHITFDEFSIKNRVLGLELACLPRWKITKLLFLTCTLFFVCWNSNVFNLRSTVYIFVILTDYGDQVGLCQLEARLVSMMSQNTNNIKHTRSYEGVAAPTYHKYKNAIQALVLCYFVAASQPARAQLTWFLNNNSSNLI